MAVEVGKYRGLSLTTWGGSTELTLAPPYARVIGMSRYEVSDIALNTLTRLSPTPTLLLTTWVAV